MEIRNCRGQAAVADALYFLLIVMGCAAFLFAFAGGYGRTVSDFASKRYLSEYSTSALKTILYTSTPRNTSELLFTGNPDTDAKEVDYLIAMIKQDFADDEEINSSYKDILTQNIRRVMGPVDDSFDWIFFLYLERAQSPGCDFPYVLINVVDYPTPVPVPGKSKDINITGQEQQYYYCGGSSDPIIGCNAISKTSIDNFLLATGASARAFAPMNFPYIYYDTEDSAYRLKRYNGSAELILWRSTKVDKTLDAWIDLDCDTSPISLS